MFNQQKKDCVKLISFASGQIVGHIFFYSDIIVGSCQFNLMRINAHEVGSVSSNEDYTGTENIALNPQI